MPGADVWGELLNRGLDAWLDAHPHVMKWAFTVMFSLYFHGQYQQWGVRRRLGMRKGDGLIFQRPRWARVLWQRVLAVFAGDPAVERWFPAPPQQERQRKRPATRPPAPFEDPQDAKTPKE